MATHNKLSEEDTSAKFITPALYQSGRADAALRRQVAFTANRIIVRGKLVTRGKAKRADYVLYIGHFPTAPIEAKHNFKAMGDGMQQALDYATTPDPLPSALTARVLCCTTQRNIDAVGDHPWLFATGSKPNSLQPKPIAAAC